MILRLIPITMIIGGLLIPANMAADTNRPAPDARESMIKSLASATTPLDSITLLYNIYDLCIDNAEEADSVGGLIYDFAKRMGYEDVALDILRDLAQIHFEDIRMLMLIEFILNSEFEPSDMQKETLIFVKIYKAYLEMSYTSEKEMKDKIVRIINNYGATYSSDPYERLMQQFLQCIFIGHETQGELLTQYLDVLERLLQNLPRQSDKLMARLYKQKAYSYTINSDPKRAVEADKKLLALYDHTEDVNHRQGRPYRSMDHFRHNSIARMLSNYSALTLEEVDSLAQRMAEIEAARPSLADKKHRVPDYRAYQLMAHGQYAEAVDPLKALVADETDHIERRMLLKQLIIAAEHSGRKAELLEASKAYAKSMEDYLDSKLSECFRELQIIFNVDQLEADSANTELKIQQQIGRRHSLRLRGLLIAAGVLSLLLLLFIALYNRYRTISGHLAETNASLAARHDELQKRTDELTRTIEEAHQAEQQKDAFIQYISSTISLPLRSMMEYATKIIDDPVNREKPFLKRFANVIRENYQALEKISARLTKLSKNRNA